MSRALLKREWALQLGRKAPGRSGAYPGLFLAGLALSLPFLHQALATYTGEMVPDRRYSFQLAGLFLVGLSSLRICVGCAASMAEEMQNHAVQLVRQLPRSGGVLGLLLTKTAVIGFPLLLEWGLFLVASTLLGLWGAPVWDWAPQRYLLVGLCSMGLFSSLGLWIGARMGDPERAVNNARVAVIMLLLGWGILEMVLKPPFLMVGALIWVALMFRQSPRLASAFQGGILCAVLVVLIPQACLLGETRFAQLSPLMAANNSSLTQADCLVYLVATALVTLLNLYQLRKS